jgi:homoserine O-acetyltransferase
MASAQSRPQAVDSTSASPWDRRPNSEAVQADAWFRGSKFRDGETLDHLKIHYATLGTPHGDAHGDIEGFRNCA